MSQKAAKMCKSPKNLLLTDKVIEYEHLNTNCTIVGSNNLHLVKKPPTPQTTFPVMQLINPVIASRPQHHQQNLIKLKPPLNILPKPSSSLAASPHQHHQHHLHQQQQQQSPKPSVSPAMQVGQPQQTTAIMPQQLLLNAAQMPMLTAPGVRFILQPQTAKISPQVQQTPQGLILQPAGQQLLQLQPQKQMVRVLTNGIPGATYLTQMAPAPSPKKKPQLLQPLQPQPKKKKPKQKLDLANIMKLSGIGDDDDVMFESDASQSDEVHHHPPPQQSPAPPPPQQTMVQVLNQTFQQGGGQQQFSPFSLGLAAPPGCLMVQRSGGFKLALGEDGRLVLQHDPTLNQDLQSQLLLQSIFGGGLLLQPAPAPSIDQQIHSQTVQTISQTIQTVQHQIVQPQTIQSVQSHIHSLLQGQHNIMQPNITLAHMQPQPQQQQQQQPQQQQQQQPQQPQQQYTPNVKFATAAAAPTPVSLPMPIATPTSTPTISIPTSTPSSTGHQQPVLKVQPFQKSVQPPVQTVHPIHHHHQPAPVSTPAPTPTPSSTPTSYVVNLTPDQLEQLKRNGQLTVNGQTIFMQRPNSNCSNKMIDGATGDKERKTSPKIKPLKSKAATEVKTNQNHLDKVINNVATAKAPVRKLIAPPAALVQPQIAKPKVAPATTTQTMQVAPPATGLVAGAKSNDVERFLGLGQHVDEQAQVAQPTSQLQVNQLNQLAQQQQLVLPPPATSAPPTAQCQPPPQRVHTIQLTPQKQQHLKSIQLQIATLSARMTPGGAGNLEMQNALKALFAEQQKILASGKLLPPDKVFYHGNQLIVNNSGIVKNEVLSPPLPQPLPLKPTVTATPTPSVAGNASVVVPEAPSILPMAAVTAPPPPPPAVTPTTTTPVASTTTATTATTATAVAAPPPMPLYMRSQLIEQQMNMDHSGAIKPDIHTPFRDKVDACKRLIRYHCFEQPVLSEKDLGKADEIFELTARHFIDKFGRMVDKYRYLLNKEGQRHVQTSELMMLDRMFLSEEQQSLMKLRQEIDECNMAMQLQEEQQQQSEPPSVSNSEDYDEWACIQRELGCLPVEAEPAPTGANQKSVNLATAAKRPFISIGNGERHEVKKHKPTTTTSVVTYTNHNHTSATATAHSSNYLHQVNTSYSSQIVQHITHTHTHTVQHHHQHPPGVNTVSSYNCMTASSSSTTSNNEENDSIDEQVQSAIDSILNLQQGSLELDETMQNILS